MNTEKKKKLNILLIVTDQQSADTLRACGGKLPVCMPEVEALGAEALCFRQAYTNAPVCTPARSCIQTGLYPSVTGMCTNIYQQGCVTHELADRPFLLSRRLSSQGYVCGYTGKWHLGMGKDKNASSEGRSLLARAGKGFMGADAYLNYGTLPTDIGYIGDDFPGHGDGGWTSEAFGNYLKKAGLTLTMENIYRGNRKGDHSKGGVITSGEKTTVDYFLYLRTKEIIRQLEAQKKPFFMMVNFWGPHEPYYVAQEDYDLFKDMRFPPWESFNDSKHVESRIHRLVQRPEKGWDFFENNLRHYFASLHSISRQIGRILDFLKSEGLYEDTFVIVTADHGDSQGCHNGMENKSGHMYDEVTRIPMIMRRPGQLEHLETQAFAQTVDLYATILDLAGYDSSCWQSGHSLLPLFEYPDRPVREYAVCESVSAFPLVSAQRMYRRGSYKYVFNGGARDELYDLSADTTECHNLVDEPEYAGTLRLLREELAEAMLAHGDDIEPWYCKMNHIKEWSWP